MNLIESVLEKTPLGDIDEVAHIVCDEISTLRFTNVMTKSGKHTFQTNIKSKDNNEIDIQINSSSNIEITTTVWKQINASGDIDVSSRNYIEIVFNPGEYFMYNTKLEYGNQTDWTLSPHDIVKLSHSMSSVKSEVDSLNKQIVNKVEESAFNGAISGIQSNIEKLGAGVDRWLVSTYLYDDSDISFTSPSSVFTTTEYPDRVYTVLDSELDVTLDAGGKHIGYALTFVHFDKATTVTIPISISQEGTFYVNTKKIVDSSQKRVDAQISFTNGWNCIEFVWKSSFSLGGVEINFPISSVPNYLGMNCYYATITSRDTEYSHKMSEVIQDSSSIKTQLSDTQSSLLTKADGAIVESIKTQLNESINTAEAFKRTVLETYATNGALAKTETAVEQLSDSIKNFVTSDELSSKIEQTNNYWRTDFAENGAICGSVLFNKLGITVSGDQNSGYTTTITPTEFSGSYRGTKVFWLNQDETVTERLRVNKGIDLRTIKITPATQNRYRGLDFLGGSAII